MQQYNEIIDISLALNEKTIIYPGNPKVEIEVKEGKTSIHSQLTLGTHTATHIDAPKHIDKNSKGVDELDLSKFIGPCRVLDMLHIKDAIRISDLEKENVKAGERIIVKTQNSGRGFEQFYENYVYLNGDAADYLVQKEILLFGIDYLSVKQKGSSDTRAHDSLLNNEIGIVEGLDLSKVSPGEYFFIALPLKITNGDGSPVRAVLLK